MAVPRRFTYISVSALAIGAASLAAPAAAQNNYVGQIVKTAGSFCPIGTLNAEGQLLSIAQENTLYNLYGTTYGGDGVTTFAVPDFRGRSSISVGQGPGLTNRVLGQKAAPRPI